MRAHREAWFFADDGAKAPATLPPEWTVDLFPAQMNQELKNSGKMQESAVSTNNFLIS
jgi:hypothetical protein